MQSFLYRGVTSGFFREVLEFDEVRKAACILRANQQIDKSRLTTSGFHLSLHHKRIGEIERCFDERLKVAFPQVQPDMRAAFIRKSSAHKPEKRLRISPEQRLVGRRQIPAREEIARS